VGQNKILLHQNECLPFWGGGGLFTIAFMKWDLWIGIKISSSQSEFTIPVKKKSKLRAHVTENSCQYPGKFYFIFR